MFRRGLFLPLVCAAVAAASASAHADARSPWAESRPEDLSIKLVTFGPGDDVYNFFGHNALVVEDTARHMAGLYNFGMFSFGPEMLPSYMKGKLTFWVAETPVRATYTHYMRMNRSIHVQELDLAPAARVEMAAALANKALPENREYLYDHYHDNCSTRLRDLIDRAIGGQLHAALDHPARYTYRGHTMRMTQKSPLVAFALVFWMNDHQERALKQWDETFLPSELEQQVARAHYKNASGADVPLVAASYSVFEARRPPIVEVPTMGWPWSLLFGCVSGGLLWLTALWWKRANSKLARALFGLQHAAWGTLFGILGTAGFLMWAFTEHTVTYRNENMWLANPLTLLWLPLGIGIAFGSERARNIARYVFYTLAGMSMLGLVLKLLPNFDQDTSLTMTLLIPLNLGGALAHRALQRVGSEVAAPVAAERPLESRA
ncbi:MAG TPA: DUF4105 domain-containing protein [Polyangiales bacterium]|nr:DUF4105 domain-containing protein [Polyangiales bacterium]